VLPVYVALKINNFSIIMDLIEYPIDGILDLHTFHPKDVAKLVPDYLELCKEKNIKQVRIIHGKGIGVLRRIVHSILERDPLVEKFWHEEGSGGSWGATIVQLK
jgi:DNA-nicking Smr family endonuclease